MPGGPFIGTDDPSDTRTPMRDPEALKRRIAELQIEHRSLDVAIEAIAGAAPVDELQVRRLKKRKLQLKDAIVLLQMQLTPDVPA